MLVVVEGPERTGKTTLVEELAAGLPGEVLAANNDPGHSLFYEDALSGYDPLDDKTLILDRWHVSEYVYPEIFRQATEMIDPAVRRHIEMYMSSRGAVIIYAVRDFADLHLALSTDPGELRPASLALALERFDDALNEGANRGYVFEHDHERQHLAPKDVALVAGQALDDILPFHGITQRWIGNPDPRWVVAVSGYSDTDIPGRRGPRLDPTIAHLLRNIPDLVWRGVALVDISDLSDERLAAYAHLARADAWLSVGEDARDRVLDVVQPSRSLALGYAVLNKGDDLLSKWW